MGSLAHERGSVLPAPREVQHTWNLFWWLVLITPGVAAYVAETTLNDSSDRLELPTGNAALDKVLRRYY